MKECTSEYVTLHFIRLLIINSQISLKRVKVNVNLNESVYQIRSDRIVLRVHLVSFMFLCLSIEQVLYVVI